MLGLAAVVATPLRLPARACAVLACVAAMLCATTSASALESVQTKTRVWHFSFASPLNIRSNALASAEQPLGFSPAQSEVASASPHAARGAGAAGGAASRVLGFTERNLQKGFTKHGADFGLKGNWNPSRAADFSRAINQHINDPVVTAIQGTYRGAPVTHYFNPATGVNVMADSAGSYVSGWRLGVEQMENLFRSGAIW